MTMIPSDEEFEAYLAQQQAELARASEPAAPSPAPRQGTLEGSQRVLGVVMPIALIAVVGVIVWRSGALGPSKYDNPWDKMLDTAAWMGGREYNADADTLTERLTFRNPRKKSADDR